MVHRPLQLYRSCTIEEVLSGFCPYTLHLFFLGWNNRGIVWGDESLALLYESWYKTRRTRTWVMSPGDLKMGPRILIDRSSEDVYADPGSPMLRRTTLGTYVLAQFKNGNGRNSLLLNGSGATPDGYIPFLDLQDM